MAAAANRNIKMMTASLLSKQLFLLFLFGRLVANASSEENIFHHEAIRGKSLLEMNENDNATSRLPYTSPEDNITINLLFDIAPGNQSSYPQTPRSFPPPSDPPVYQPFVLFAVFTEEHGYEPWISDGTTTRILMDIYQGSNSSISTSEYGTIEHFEAIWLKDRLYFNAFHPDHGMELWVTTGMDTNKTSVQLWKDIIPGSVGSNPQGLMALNDEFFVFTARVSQDSKIRGLFVSDGTSLQRLSLGPRLDETWDLELDPIYHVLAGQLFFVAQSDEVFDLPHRFGARGRQLWVTNGTQEGTWAVHSMDDFQVDRLFRTTGASNEVYFRAFEANGRPEAVWVTANGGDPNSTRFFLDAVASGMSPLLTHGSKTQVMLSIRRDRIELWDINSNGTHQKADPQPSFFVHEDLEYHKFVVPIDDEGTYMFLYQNTSLNTEEHLQLWIWNGTHEVLQEPDLGTNLFFRGGATIADGRILWFTLSKDFGNRTMWVTDPLDRSTRILYEFDDDSSTGSSRGSYFQWVALDETTLLVQAFTMEYGFEWYKVHFPPRGGALQSNNTIIGQGKHAEQSSNATMALFANTNDTALFTSDDATQSANESASSPDSSTSAAASTAIHLALALLVATGLSHSWP